MDREELALILAELPRTQLNLHHRGFALYVLYGLPGVERTQTVVTYAFRARKESYSDGFYCINAALKESRLDGFRKIAMLISYIKTGDELALDKVTGPLLGLLQNQALLLLILDNLDSISVIKGFLPNILQGVMSSSPLETAIILAYR